MNDKPIYLDMWSVDYEPNNGFTAPELLRRVLIGTCTGHPLKPDGSEIRTSPIAAVKGRVVTTQSRVYRLGRIHPKYREFLRSIGYPFDWRNPIKIIIWSSAKEEHGHPECE